MPNMEDQDVVRSVQNYIREADSARTDRMIRNKRNFEFYHLRQDYSEKQPGQSREFLGKQANAVEQITSFVAQGLIDFGNWFSIDPRGGNNKPLFSSDQAREIMKRQLDLAGFYTFIQDMVKSGLLGSLMICKIHGKMVDRPQWFTEKRRDFLGYEETLRKRKLKSWQLKLDLIRQEDFYPDPTGEGLYVIQKIEMDYWQLLKLAKENPDVYDVSAVEELQHYQKYDDISQKERETGQNKPTENFRKRITLHECWGTILDAEGNVCYENSVCTIANDNFLIQKPMPNPFWHGKMPFVYAPIVRVPGSVWHKALMDGPTDLNQAINELYNLILDSGLMSVFGIKQIRENWMSDPDQITNGVVPTMTLRVNATCPPGQKVLERIDTGALSQEAINVLELTTAEFNQSALTNDIRMGSFTPRAVKATEVVEASNALSGMFGGYGKAIESGCIEQILELAWLTTMQNADDLDSDEVASLIGQDKADEISKLSSKKRFEQTVLGHDFKVYGLTQTLNKVKDLRSLTSMIQTLFSIPMLQEEFARRYDPSKIVTEMVRNSNINEDKLKLDQEDEMLEGVSGAAPPVETPNDMSQMQEAGAGPAPEQNVSALPQTAFPNDMAS